RMVDSDSPASTAANWIAEFCDRPGNEFFCKVDEDYIRDRFNLTGLGTAVPNYHRAMKLLLDGPEQLDLASDDPQLETLQRSAELLYGLIHVRFIMSVQGMPQMVAKWMLGHFGVCRRVFCEKQRVLPVGLSDIPGEATVKVYCPAAWRCTSPTRPATCTSTAPTLAQGFPICYFYPIRNAGPSRQPISLRPACTASRFTRWPISCSRRRPPAPSGSTATPASAPAATPGRQP
ncbi:hypothetical protein BOX15_Mlig032160g1, partial [Macrostomum lignano]